MMNVYFQTKRAFTLAEVLITLAVIGVVAAMVLPGVIQNTQDMELKVKYKQAFALASQVWKAMQSENQLTQTTDIFENPPTASTSNFANFSNYFITQKRCYMEPENSNVSFQWQCWANGGLNESGSPPGSPFPNGATAAFIDNSGRSWSYLHSAYTRVDGIFVDTNGPAPPNHHGKDRFFLPTVTENCNVNNIYTDDSCTVGIQSRVVISPDILNSNFACKTPPCYYRSWIIN